VVASTKPPTLLRDEGWGTRLSVDVRGKKKESKAMCCRLRGNFGSTGGFERATITDEIIV